jgi:protein-tyrosine phosphatase
MAQQWLSAGAVHFIASDAHNITSRPLRLKETFDRVAAADGEEVAHALLVDNPLAAFEGRPLPYVPELAEDLVPNDSRPQPHRRRKRFWFF